MIDYIFKKYKKKQEEVYKQNKKTRRLKKQQEKGQTLFNIKTTRTFENIPLFSPRSFHFFRSTFKSSHDDDPEDIFPQSQTTRQSVNL